MDKHKVIDGLSLDAYLLRLNQEQSGSRTEESLYDKNVRLRIIPESVESKYDYFGTLVGLIAGVPLLSPLVAKVLTMNPSGSDVIFKHYSDAPLWNLGIHDTQIEQPKDEIKEGEERTFVVCAYPQGFPKEMKFFIMAYEDDNGEMRWINNSS